MKRVLLILLAVPVLLVAAVLIVPNTGPGRTLIEQQARKLTGGMIRIEGLHGRFPDALRAKRLAVADTTGVWLTLTDVSLDWSPFALLHGTARIGRLCASTLDLARLAVAAPAPPAPSKPPRGGFSLPVRVELQALRIDRATIAAAVAGTGATVAITGSAAVASLQSGRASVSIDRLDSAGAYRVTGRISPSGYAATVEASEPSHGLAATLGHLPDLGPLALSAHLDGPRTAEALRLTLSAGPLRAHADGTIDLAGKSASLAVTATAPAMAPRPDVSWRSIDLSAQVQGSFTRPDATAHLAVAGLSAGGAAISSLTAELSGNQGAADLHAAVTVASLPGPKPDLLAAAPLLLTAHAHLDDPSRPVRFTLRHPLVQADGTARTAGDLAVTVHTIVPDIAKLAAIGGVDLQGRTEATATLARHGDVADVTLAGTATVSGGLAPVPALLGDARFSADASLAGQDITVRRATLDGRAIHVALHGTDTLPGLDFAWTLGLSDLAALNAQASGHLDGTGTVKGPQTGLAVDAALKGVAGGAGVPPGPVAATLRVRGLPAAPAATLSLTGAFDGAPVALDLAAEKHADGSAHATISKLAWRSATATGEFTLPAAARLPVGTLDLKMTRLADLQPILHQPVQGSLSATVKTLAGSPPVVRVDLAGTGLGLPGESAGKLTVSGTIRNPAAAPDLALTLAAEGIASGAITGSARVTATGPMNALLVRASTSLQGVAGAPATAALAARIDATAKRVVLQTLTADAKGEALRLAAPATVDFAKGLSVDRLRLALGDATLSLAGRVSPTLALSAQLRHVTPALAKPFAPGLDAAGVISADATLSGTTAAPSGRISVTATGMKLRTGPAGSLPAADLRATATLAGKSAARVDATLDAGPRVRLALAGTAPLSATGPLALHADGTLDLAVLDPILQAQGRRARGQARLAATIAGTAAAPNATGSLTLADGEVQDFAQGVHLTAVTARLVAAGQSLRIASFVAHAGAGTIGVSGSVGILAPTLPVDLTVTARDATPLASDLLTATLNADLTVKGSVAGGLAAAGSVFLKRTEITIPDSFPPSVAVLNVVRAGQKPPPPAPPAAPVRLDLTIDAPQGIFVRGHGLDSELGGKLIVTGSSTKPQVAGGFDMRRGQFSLAGTTLQFARGRVGFDGTGVNGKIDPTLDFEADSAQGGVVATLKIGGYADAPKITLSSVPDLPQDEVLAHLLFGQSVKSLSTFQVAEIAAALAELGGGGGSSPLDAVRKGLGLDQLSVGGGSAGAGASVQAGRYVAPGVFIGAKQNTTGGGTQAQLNVDLTRHLKLQTQLGSGGSLQGATLQDDPGSSVGLSYGFDY